jgi:hypothetical protein
MQHMSTQRCSTRATSQCQEKDVAPAGGREAGVPEGAVEALQNPWGLLSCKMLGEANQLNYCTRELLDPCGEALLFHFLSIFLYSSGGSPSPAYLS